MRLGKVLWWFGIGWAALSIAIMIFGNLEDVGDVVRFYSTMVLSNIWFATSLLVRDK